MEGLCGACVSDKGHNLTIKRAEMLHTTVGPYSPPPASRHTHMRGYRCTMELHSCQVAKGQRQQARRSRGATALGE